MRWKRAGKGGDVAVSQNWAARAKSAEPLTNVAPERRRRTRPVAKTAMALKRASHVWHIGCCFGRCSSRSIADWRRTYEVAP